MQDDVIFKMIMQDDVTFLFLPPNLALILEKVGGSKTIVWLLSSRGIYEHHLCIKAKILQYVQRYVHKSAKFEGIWINVWLEW